jgi:hypothetical protein
MATNPSSESMCILLLMTRGFSRQGAGEFLQGGSVTSANDLMAATRQMQQMNQSFNLQYLLLQQQMQSENRQYTALSNVLKTRHDTAKNAINNVR